MTLYWTYSRVAEDTLFLAIVAGLFRLVAAHQQRPCAMFLTKEGEKREGYRGGTSSGERHRAEQRRENGTQGNKAKGDNVPAGHIRYS